MSLTSLWFFSSLLEWLLEPLSFDFMRQAIAVGCLLGILGAVVGSYLILQQMSMMGGVISHAVLPGISLAFFLQINLAFGAFVAGLLSSLVVIAIELRSRVKVDAAMALTLSSFLALGIVLINRLKTNQIDLNGILFGDILGISPQDLWQVAIITGIVLILNKLFFKELEFYTFDPTGAQACGLPVKIIHFGLICAITITIVASMQTVGVLLVTALMVGPSLSAYLLVKELWQMMFLGSVLGMLGSTIGIYLSYYGDLPSGAAITLTIFSIFVATFLFSPNQGLINNPENRQYLRSLLKNIDKK